MNEGIERGRGVGFLGGSGHMLTSYHSPLNALQPSIEEFPGHIDVFARN